jgi:hypothetical protein
MGDRTRPTLLDDDVNLAKGEYRDLFTAYEQVKHGLDGSSLPGALGVDDMDSFDANISTESALE